MGTLDTANRLYVRKRKKVWIFTLKMELRNYWAIMLQKKHFSLKTFFHNLLENFICVVQAWSIYLRDTNFKKGDEEKNRRTKVASNPPIFEQDVRNRCLHTSLIFDFSFATYILRYGRSKNDLTRFPYRISVTRTCTPNFPEPAKNE